MGVWELSVPSLKLVCNSKIILKYKVKKKKKKRQDQQSWGPAVALGLWLRPGEAGVGGMGGADKQWGRSQPPSPGSCSSVELCWLVRVLRGQQGL